MNGPRDAPYPQLKNTHTMARKGRPWTDYKPPPSAPIWGVIQGLGSYYILLAALELDVFDTLAVRGPSLSGDLAEELSVSPPHLESLLDALTALTLIDQYEGIYEVNDTTRRYLVSDGPATMADLIAVAPGPHENWQDLANTIRKGTPATPIDNDPAAFYVPLVEGTFTTIYRTAMRADLRIRYSALDAPRILDLGAGAGAWSIAMLERAAGSSAVINDLPAVLDVARRKATEFEVNDRCEFRPGDFHSIPIEDDAYDIVVLSHVCRTEGEEGAVGLIDRAWNALKPDGRLLLADYFVDLERKFNPHAVLMGTTMMASTVNGFPIRNDQVATWLRDRGFEAIRLIEPIGFQFVYSAQKPRRSP